MSSDICQLLQEHTLQEHTRTLLDGTQLTLCQYRVSSGYAPVLGLPVGSSETVLKLLEYSDDCAREITTSPGASHHLDTRYFHVLYASIENKHDFDVVATALRMATTAKIAGDIQETLDQLIN